MARIRTVKPEMAKHEALFDLEAETGLPIRFAWAMLPTQCDREGRFRWRPRQLKSDILPYDDIDFSRVLDAWGTRGFVVKYRVGDAWYGCIPTWRKHQVVNNRESPSELPSIDENDEIFQWVADACPTRAPIPLDVHVHAQAEREGEREREGEGIRKNDPDGSFVETGDFDLQPVNGKSVNGRAPPPCPHDAIVAVYHEELPELPRVRDWTPQRRAHLSARWKANPSRQDVDWWRRLFRFVREECPFLLGEGPPRGTNGAAWQASLPWLVKSEENLIKVVEGNYQREH